MLKKNNLKNNRLLIASLIITALLSLSVLIIYQYNKYNQVENRLNSTYSGQTSQSVALYKLFSTFSEAEYLFRMYSINFNKNDFNDYNLKLDTIKFVLDSLSSLPIENNPIKNQQVKNNNLALEYLSLKKQVDHLVIYAKDSLILLEKINFQPTTNITRAKKVNNDSLLNTIIKDNRTLTNNIDTLIKKKQSFFKRIFNSKDDTVLNNNERIIEKINQQDIILKEKIEQLLVRNNRINDDNFKKLQKKFVELKVKERALISSNYTLLYNLKNGIERLREVEFINYKKKQEADFLAYNNNTKTIRTQLIGALSLMVFMIILIINYQRQVRIYEQNLINEKEYANQMAEEKTSVLANISHEIRSPLNSLRGLISILKNNNNGSVIDKEIIQSIDYDITIINSTINDILSLSKLESDSLQIKQEQIIIYNLINDIISLHKYQAKLKKLKLHNENLIPKNILINSNQFRVKQIISNLITNAIKYTEKGQITIHSEIRDNSTLIVKVEDTGIGISKEQGEQIFRKYYVANNKSKSGGFGLGLYISKILSEQLGAKLSFSSSLGKGTIFTFELPLSIIKDSTLTQESDHLINEISSDLNIVFIDDSKINLFFMQQLFKDNGNVHYFIEPHKALDYIKTNKVDIVITDLKMPKISGWEILNMIKSDEAKQHIKVFASTAEPLLLEDNDSQFQFDGVINKPIKENELVSKIINS